MNTKTHRNHKCGWITRGGLVQDTDAQTKANSLFQALASTLPVQHVSYRQFQTVKLRLKYFSASACITIPHHPSRECD
jgi:hypothetical protein